MKYLVLCARLLIGGIFIYASLSKIPDPAGFAEAIRNYAMLPPAVTNLLALVLPWIEFIAGAFLVLGIMTRPSALLISGMMGVFVAALVYAYSIGLDINCGCFGTPESSAGRITILTLLRDVGLFMLSLFVLFGDRGQPSVYSGTESRV